MKERKAVSKGCGERGFTLVELLMVLLVMSVLAGILSVMGIQGLAAFQKARKEAELVRNVTLAFEMIRRDLTGAIYIDPATGSAVPGVNFVGIDQTDAGGKANDTIRFFTLLSPESTARSDLTSVNLRRDSSAAAKRFLRASLGTGPSGIPPLSLEGVTDFEPLLFSVRAFDAEYLRISLGNFQASYDASTEGKLPRAVRIRLTVESPGGKERTFTQTVMLPMEGAS